MHVHQHTHSHTHPHSHTHTLTHTLTHTHSHTHSHTHTHSLTHTHTHTQHPYSLCSVIQSKHINKDRKYITDIGIGFQTVSLYMSVSLFLSLLVECDSLSV